MQSTEKFIDLEREECYCKYSNAPWRSGRPRQSHKLKITGSNPVGASSSIKDYM